MTTDEVLAIIHDRGLYVVLLPSGIPALRGPNAQVLANRPLMRVLELPVHRDEILRRLHAGTLPQVPPYLQAPGGMA